VSYTQVLFTAQLIDATGQERIVLVVASPALAV
jgi:hypothetical protein